MDHIDIELKSGIPVQIINNLYNDEELRLIWEELEFLTYPHKLLGPNDTNSATENGVIQKNNLGIFLDDIWQNRNLSNILMMNRKIFENNMEVLRRSSSWFFQNFTCNTDTTLLSYYENNDYYKPHYDLAVVTVLTWFFREPKCFDGGDLILWDQDEKHVIEVMNNRTVVIPSFLIHEVTPISMKEQYQGQKLGRYCMTQFLGYKL